MKHSQVVLYTCEICLLLLATLDWIPIWRRIQRFKSCYQDKWKCALLENHVILKQPGVLSSSATYSVAPSLNFSPFNLPTMADSVPFYTETTTCQHGSFSMQSRFTLQSVALNVTHISFFFFFLPPVLHWQLLPYQQMCYVYISIRTFMPHTSCFFRLANNPIESVTRRCNTSRNSKMFSLHSNTINMTRGKVVQDAILLVRTRWRTEKSLFLCRGSKPGCIDSSSCSFIDWAIPTVSGLKDRS